MSDALTEQFNEAHQALSQLDFDDLNAKAAEYRELTDKNNAGIARIDKQLDDISAQIRDIYESDGNRVADALLANDASVPIEALAPSRETLEERRAALTKARKQLVWRNQDIRAEVQGLEGAAKTRTRDALAPLVSVLFEEAKAHGKAITELYAAL